MSTPLNIAIIGVGQIGSRHLQALSNLRGRVDIHLVDKSSRSLEIACERFQRVYKDDRKRITLKYFNSIQDLEARHDLVIVATDARERSKLIKEVVLTRSVRYMILEKVLFQTEDEYHEIDYLLRNKNISAWVNCVLRTTDFYRDLKSTLNKNCSIDMVIDGTSWGLACNSIHYMDLFSFFTDCNNFQFTETDLSEKIQDSKRLGYKEFSGTLVGVNSSGHTLTLSCREGECSQEDKKEPISIQINNGDKKHVIESYVDREHYKAVAQGGERDKAVRLPMQSQITHLFAESIFKHGTCGLPVYADSMVLHLSLIRVLLRQMSRIKGKEIKRCPIT